MGLGAEFFASVLKSGDVKEFLGLRPNAAVFLATEIETFEAIHNHALKYNAIPSLDALLIATGGDPDLAEDESQDPPAYLYDLIRERYIANATSAAMVETRSVLQEGGPEAGTEAYRTLTDLLSGVSKVRHDGMVLDLREQAASYMAAYQEKFHVMVGNAPPGILFGWPRLDYGSIGLRGGDVVSYVGRPSLGKTWMLLYTAHHAWWHQKRAVGFVTLEMDPQYIMDRFISINTNLGISGVMNANLGGAQLKKIASALHNDYPAHNEPFLIVDGNHAATVSDLVQIFRHQKVDVIFIDGAYMLKNEDPKLGQYQKVGANVELIKKNLSAALGVPVICSYQFNRDASKKAKKPGDTSQIGLEDIGYSDAIGQYSSIVIGLFEDENPETMISRKMNIMKNRHGPPSEFRVHWDLDHMDFSQWDDSEVKNTPMVDL